MTSLTSSWSRVAFGGTLSRFENLFISIYLIENWLWCYCKILEKFQTSLWSKIQDWRSVVSTTIVCALNNFLTVHAYLLVSCKTETTFKYFYVFTVTFHFSWSSQTRASGSRLRWARLSALSTTLVSTESTTTLWCDATSPHSWAKVTSTTTGVEPPSSASHAAGSPLSSCTQWATPLNRSENTWGATWRGECRHSERRARASGPAETSSTGVFCWISMWTLPSLVGTGR